MAALEAVDTVRVVRSVLECSRDVKFHACLSCIFALIGCWQTRVLICAFSCRSSSLVKAAISVQVLYVERYFYLGLQLKHGMVALFP